MSPEVQSDVLSDGVIAACAGIALSHPIKLPEDITVDRTTLFSAFQQAADGLSVSEITDTSGVKREVKVEIKGESAFLTYGEQSIRFPQTALLSSNIEKRRTAADIMLKNNSLTLQAREEFSAIISKAHFSHEDFFAATTILSGSPESFATALRDVANNGTLSPNYLVADIYGRLLTSLLRAADIAQSSWRQKVADAETWVTANTPPIAHAFPAMLQGGLLTPIEKPPADTTIGKMYEKLAHDPTVENFLPFMPVVYAFGFHSDARESALRVVQTLQMEIAYAQPEIAQAVLDLAAFIAARNRDTELADAVAVLAIERLVVAQSIERLLPTFAVLVQCAAAVSDRKEAQATLARRLENLAFVASPELLPEALDTLRVLQSIDDDLGALLGRAIATARLGLPGQPDRNN